MGKLFNLKEWLTLPEAAQHLSIVFGEEVTEADVLRLALDRRLKLSVNFVNHAKARCGKVVQYSETELLTAIASGNLPEDLKWHRLPPGAMAVVRPDLPPEEAEKSNLMLASLRIDEDRYLTLGDEITTLRGVWDLPMIGTEMLDVEHKYQMLTNGPEVTLQGLDGAFVEGTDGQVCQLQEDFDDNAYQPGSNAAQERLKQRIANKFMWPWKAKRLMQQHQEQRKKFREWKKTRPLAESYYPAGGLPKDGVIVVRTAALRDFEQTVIEKPSSDKKSIATTERDSLLIIIAALCDYSAIKYRERGAAAQIARLTEEIGATVSDDTVRRALAKIPDALESRMK